MVNTLAIGIDGGEWDIIDSLIAQGALPNLEKIISDGISGPLSSVKPPISPPAWTSIQTGVNPGKHGIFDFHSIKPNYEHEPINSSDRRAVPFWQILNEEDVSTGLFKMPFSYPPDDVDGFIVTGFPTPNSVSDFARPKSIADSIGDPSDLFEDWSFQHRGEYDNFKKNIIDVSIKQTRTLLSILNEHDPEFVMTVYDGCDRIQHFYWKYYDESHPFYKKESPLASAIPDYYQTIDNQIGKIIETIDNNVDFLIISDHGFGPLAYDIYIEEWLSNHNFLTWKDESNNPVDTLISILGKILQISWNITKRLGLANSVRHIIPDRIFSKGAKIGSSIQWDETDAFFTSLSGQAICVNLKDTYDQGTISEKEYNTFVDNLITKLLTMQHPENGVSVIQDVHKTREIFSGAMTDEAPDLIIETHPEYTLKGGRSHSIITTAKQNSQNRSGDHRQNGIFIAKGPSFEQGDVNNLSILDIAPLLLYLYDCAIPEFMDGEVPTDVISHKIKSEREIKYTNKYAGDSQGDRYWTNAEQAQINDQLESMGYL